ncbi:CHAT domain-containing protein [Argonema antarcticum]|uniref:CHAT domain-containing protein n=1 Tax=Argonema antarcticum TaxID=2942763 RepID=UPI0020139CAD|nr:CHAT domain-containing tetratricopeptide repeat protein [Argonema antarcticum]MCL1469485.1 CHAT domain-containing protein [Argonema antarcticum A004/B2]
MFNWLRNMAEKLLGVYRKYLAGITLKAKADRLLNLGIEQCNKSLFNDALESLQQALTIYRKIGNRQGEAFSLGDLGNAYYSLGEFQIAIDYHQQCLTIAREIRNRQGEAFSLGNLGSAYCSLGQYQLAINYHQQLLAIARKIGNRPGEAISLGNLGIAYNSLGEYKLAINYHQQCLTIAREIGNRQWEAASLGNLGNNYFFLRQYQKAIKYNQQQLTIAREIGDRQLETNSLGNLGNTYCGLGEYQRGSEYYHHQLAIARETGYRQGQANSLGNLGNAYHSLGEYEKGIKYHQQYQDIAREMRDRQGESSSLNNLGLAFLRTNQIAKAEETLYAAMQIRETLRSELPNYDHKVSIFEIYINTYQLLQEVLVAQNKFDTALEISERGRTRAFVELLTKTLFTTNVGAGLAEDIKQEQITSQQNPPLQANVNLSSAQIQQIAQSQKATIIEYSILIEDIYIWVILPNGEIAFRRANLQPLQQLNQTLANLESIILKSRVSIGIEEKDAEEQKIKLETEFKRDNQGRYPLLQLLYEILISPIADLLPKHPNAKVIFIPHYNLFLVPFPALQNPADGSYLIENHTILTAPSIQILDLTHQHHQNIRGLNQAALVVGDPLIASKFSQEPYNLKPIPAAKEAAQTIAALLETEAITGEKATKAVIMDRILGVRIAHISAHGLLDDFGDSGIPGAIILAPNSATDDGAIRAIDILALKLNSEIVVLSACSTGKGKITGDGIIGLSRCFILAGVPSVIVSLWNMGALSAKLLMTEFYQNLERGMDRAAALRYAMLTTKAEEGLDSPGDWAAFTLIGETESLSLNTQKIEQQELTMPFSPESTPQEIIDAFFKLLETSNVFSNYLEFMEELKAEPADSAQEIAKRIEAWCKDKLGIEKGINNKLCQMGAGGTESKPDEEVAREFNDRLLENRTRLGSPPPSSSSGTKDKN